MRDTDILEQIGAVGILRTVGKAGRDRRFVRFSDALPVLRRRADELAGQWRLPTARRLTRPRRRVLAGILEAAEAEAARAQL